MENIIREAIANKQLLEFVYNDKKRVVEPYTLGCSHKGDNTLSAFQIEGGSNSSKDLGWRQFIIENIEKFGKGDKLSDSKGLFSTEILNNGSTLLLLGDSHAGASSKIIEDLSKKYNWNFSLFNQGGCPLIENVIYTRFGMEKNRGEFDCKNYVYTLLKESKLADKVLVINRMPYYFYGPNEVGRENFFGLPLFFFNNDKIYEEYNDEYINKIENSYIKTLCDIRKKTNKMYITRPIPEISVSVPTSLIKQQSSITFEDIKIKKSDYIKRNKRIWEIQDLASKQCDIKIIDPTEYLCDDSFCYGSIEGKPLYYDDNHIGIFGNKVIFDTFKNIYNDLDNCWSVVAEAIQTILRREAYPHPYEALKALTRTNQAITESSIKEFIEELNVSEDIKKELRAITPHTYTGL